MVSAILEGAGALANDQFAALHKIGDREGARWSPDGVTLPDGFAAAYDAYVEGGWGGLSAPAAFGGQRLPAVLGVAVQEQLASANMAFQLCMMLTLGEIEAIAAHGSDAQKALYLPRIASGEWTATMNLTEPQAGSDVGAVRTSATPGDGDAWHVRGSKIFITWGEHDLAENIVHLVLARTPDAPAGTKGLSLFLLPKCALRSRLTRRLSVRRWRRFGRASVAAYRHSGGTGHRNPATGVLARFYHRYARFLANHGFEVLTYDYRGIGASRPPNLKGCGYRWRDWGEHDFEAAVRFMKHRGTAGPLNVVGHSFGGVIPGLAPALLALTAY